MQPLGRSRARAGTSWCLAAAAAAAWCSARCLVAPTGPAGLRPAPRADVARGYERGGAEGGTGAGADTHEGGSGGSEQDVLAMWDSVGSDTGAGAHEGGSGGSEQDVLAMWDSVGSDTGAGAHEGGSGGSEQDVLAMWDSVGSDTGAGAHEGGSGGSEQDVLAMWDSVGSDTGAGAHEGGPHGSPELLSSWDSLGSATGGQPYQSGGHDTGSGQRLVGFGKHRDLTYQEALSQDPNYCDWVMRESKSSDASPMVMDFVHWLEQNVPSAGGGAPANGFDLGSSSDPSGWLPAVEPSGDAGQRLVGFGKHRDLTYQEALSQDPQYCDWVMRESKSSDATPMLMDDFAHWLEQNVPSAGGGAPANGFDQGSASDPSGWLPAVEPSGDSNPKVGFGKHKHLTYEEALVMDKRYCQWVVTFMESKEDPIPTMVEFAKWLRERGIEPGT
ncbi:unnamed protein product [Prorocentrum cordatum]|uniref:Uncharacterized protein n=1 Tax=Prorocentrum cordatum TaxID=2364126 RepID=A0ABN9TMZ5_9DINO|nr:unnamed protein product [Polarella glacialis]